MDCSCRTAALRIFVKSIAQIQVPARAPTRRIAQYQTPTLYNQPSHSYNQRVASAFASSSRALHTSCTRRSAADAVQSAEWEIVETPTRHEDEGVTAGSARPSQRTTDRSFEFESAYTDTATPNLHYAGDGDFGSPRSFAQRAKKEKKRPQPGPGGEWFQPKAKETWMSQKAALKKKFPGGWNPRKKLSPDALVGIRMLHKQFPEEYTTEVLAQKFEVSAEAIRRILKSRWTPDPDKEEERQERWFNRGKQVWTHWAALGKKPPRKWRAEGIVRDPVWNKPRGPNHKDKDARAEAQRRLAKGLLG